MFQRARLRLTIWYVVALVGLFVAVGASAYFLLRRDLDAEIDRSISFGLADAVNHQDRGGRSPDGGVPSDGGFGGEGDGRYRAPGQDVSTDVFTIELKADGSVLSNPRGIDLAGFPVGNFAEEAEGGKVHAEDITAAGRHFRVMVQPLARAQPDGGAYALAGRSLEARDSQLRALALIFGSGALAGVVLAAGGGFWLAGRTLDPIKKSIDTQRRFVSDASHELRTPVAIVATNADILLQHPDEAVEANIEQVAAIRDSASRMARLVADLLVLARADEERVQMVQHEMRLDEMLALAGRDMGALAADKGVVLDLKITPVTIRADADRLRQLTMILLDNAVKYTAAGGKITLGCHNEGRRAVVTVRDTGAGIPAEDLPHVFERFYRSDASRSRSGMGLGLSIGQWIAEAHGGRVSAESEPGKGSTFTVSLPRR